MALQGFGNPKYESGLQAAPSYTPPGGNSGGVASPRWGSGVASAAGSALSGASNAISGAGSAISGALSPRHRGRGSESMLGQVRLQTLNRIVLWLESAILGALPPRHRGRGSESMLGQVAPTL